MFWKRKVEVIQCKLGPFPMPAIPPKREFENMLDLLREAERYDSRGEFKLSIDHLNILQGYITEFISFNEDRTNFKTEVPKDELLKTP